MTLVLAAIVGSSSDQNKDTGSARPGPVIDQQTSAAAPAPAPAAPAVDGGFGDGVYLVGTDMPAGTYATDGKGTGVLDSCYWARLRNRDGAPGTGIDDMIDNYFGKGKSRFSAKTGEFVEIKNCVYRKVT